MEVILLDRIRNLGNLGDKVNVKPGYGRNFLIPQGKAISATPANLKVFEARRSELEKKVAGVLAEAQKRAEAFVDKSVTIVARAGDEGRLYGSIAPQDIAALLTEEGLKVDKGEVIMSTGALREVGEFSVDISFHSDVTVAIKVIIEREEANH